MIKKAKVQQAVEIVKQLNSEFQKDSSKKKNLLEDDNGGSLFLQISLKKIPNTKNIKMIKMTLPNSIPLEGACLITGDLDKKNHKAEIDPDILHYKEILNNSGVTGISEVITLRQLRTDYKSYESKQLLLAAFDIFIADKKIAGALPRVLGKHFFKKRKFPIQIDLKSADLKKNIENALSEKVLYCTGHGNSCALEVAHLDMDDAKIVQNVMAAVNILSEKMPGSKDNIMGLYLRLARSKSIPIYMSYDGASDVKFEAEKKMDITVDELSTLDNATVRVYSDGRVECTRKLKNGVTEIVDGDVSSAEEEIEEEQHSRKRKRSEKNSLPECDQLNDDVVQCENAENTSPQGDSQAKGAKKLKKSQKQNVKVEEAISNDSEDLLPAETRKMKKAKKETGKKIVMNTPNDSEGLQASIKKMKKSKKETTNKEDTELSPNDSEGPETVTSAIETKKLKKNKKQITNMKQAEPLKQSEGSKATRSATKKMKKSEKETTNAEDFFPDEYEDPKTVSSAIDTKKLKKNKKQVTDPETVSSAIETKKLKKNKKQVTSIKQAELVPNQSEDSQVKGAKKLKKTQEQNVKVKETIAFSNDSEDLPIESTKMKKSKKETAKKNVMNTPNDSEGPQAARSSIATKKTKSSKKETINQKETEFFPDDSEEPETVTTATETKKLKKNKKQITNMKQAKLLSKQSEDLKPVNSSSKSRGNPKMDMNDRVSRYSINESFNQSKKPNKRKRVDSESASVENIKENKFEFKSPVQAQKKKRLEDNVKQNLAMKKARRNKMKVNRPKSK